MESSKLLAEERGLVKTCSSCQRRLTLDNFYIRIKKLTADGRWYRMSKCIPCYRHGRNAIRPPTPENRLALESARRKAQRRLSHMVPELFQQLFDEEKKKAGFVSPTEE